MLNLQVTDERQKEEVSENYLIRVIFLNHKAESEHSPLLIEKKGLVKDFEKVT